MSEPFDGPSSRHAGEEAEASHRKYLERRTKFLEHGYDIEQERAFVIDKAKPLTGKILEVGTGKGHFSLALAKEGASITSIDVKPEDQHFARLHLRYHGLETQVRLEVANAESMPFPDSSFDLVCSVNVIHHLAALDPVCREMARVLKPSGRIVVSDFNAHGFKVMEGIHEGEGGHHDTGPHTLLEAGNCLAALGFRIEEHHNLMQDTLVARRN